ncbi:ribonuclease PH [Candidatus Dependentiae bacterium]
MKNFTERKDGRKPSQIRNISVTFNAFGYADGSVLFEVGNTKVLCSVSLQQGVPHFLKGSKKGWLTAEYSMLPTSTTNRIARESTLMRKNGRSVEISRLIGRSLRSIVDLDFFGERTIYVDCDVLQADGGTRTASITGACLALRAAVANWLQKGMIRETIITDYVAAISVGVLQDQVLLDLNFQEDSSADADFNFVLTKSNTIVEIQGASEGQTVTWDHFERAKQGALQGVAQLFAITDGVFNKKFLANVAQNSDNKTKKVPLFSLLNRQDVSK